MDHGKLLALDRPDALKRTVGGDSVVKIHAGRRPDALVAVCTSIDGVTGDHRGRRDVMITTRAADGLLPRIIATAEASGFPVRDVSVAEPTLETVFITLTGKELRE